MQNADHIQQLKNSLQAAHESLIETLEALESAKATIEQYYGAVSVWYSQFRTVSENAELAGQTGLYLASIEIVAALDTMQDSSVEMIIPYCELLVEWSEQANSLLEAGFALTDIDKLLAPVPEKQHGEIRAVFGMDKESQYQLLSPIIDDAVDVLETLLGDWDEKNDNSLTREFMEGFSVILDNINLAAEMIDFDDLCDLCSKLSKQFNRNVQANRKITQQYVQEHLSWLIDLKYYLGHTSNITLLEISANIMPEHLDAKSELELETSFEVESALTVKPSVESDREAIVESAVDAEVPIEVMVAERPKSTENMKFSVSDNPVEDVDTNRVSQSSDKILDVDKLIVNDEMGDQDVVANLKVDAIGTESIATTDVDFETAVYVEKEKVAESAKNINATLDIEPAEDVTVTAEIHSDIEIEAAIEAETNSKPDSVPEVNPVLDVSYNSGIKSKSVKIDFDTSSVLGILGQELSELLPEMNELVNLVKKYSTGSSQLKEAGMQYLMLVERFSEASNELGLQGLKKVCEYIELNFNLLLKMKAKPKAKFLTSGVFREWQALVMDYLGDPEQEDKSVLLISFLQSESWPKPLADKPARRLLVDLVQPIDVPELTPPTSVRATKASQKDIDVTLPKSSSQGIVDAFFKESPFVASKLSNCIENISIGVNVAENISSAQRCAHTLKGSASLLGITGIANMTHHLEDILEYLTTRPENFPRQLLAVLQEATDCVESMLDAMQGKETVPESAQKTLQSVLDWANRIDRGELPLAGKSEQQGSRSGVFAESHSDDALPDLSDPKPDSGEKALYVPIRVIDDMYKIVGELATMNSQVQSYFNRIKKQELELQIKDRVFRHNQAELEDMVNIQRLTGLQRQAQQNIKSDSNFDSIEMDQYDELHGSLNCFIETVLDVNEGQRAIKKQVTELETLVLEQQKLNIELQHMVMDARMVSVNSIVPRLHRAVRQTSRATGKHARLLVEGEDLSIDCDVLTNLTDPIIHILRNAVDHGIEALAEREASGKPEVGKIELKISQVGNNINIICSDDGGGLDYKRIRKSAIKKKLLDKGAKASHQELAKLLLTGGFTTRDKVSQISGRGVGLDIVNNVISSYGGKLSISDNEPKGCRVSLQLPVSLITTHTILVKSGGELFAVPSNSLYQIVPPQLGQYIIEESDPVYTTDEKNYSAKFLFSLTSNVNVDTSLYTSAQSTPQVALLVEVDDEEVVVVLVDQVVSSNELVLKGMGTFLPDIQGLSGVSILGDGTVVPVLNLKDLLRSNTNTFLHTTAQTNLGVNTQRNRVAKILIVDDSMSIRKLLCELVEDAGYKALVASNGVEAIDIMRKSSPDVVLSDMEMPKMTGLELTSNIRADKEFGNLPVIMITSRTSKKHRKQAKKAGVSEYLTKPYAEDELLDLIHSLCTKSQAAENSSVSVKS